MAVEIKGSNYSDHWAGLPETYKEPWCGYPGGRGGKDPVMIGKEGKAEIRKELVPRLRKK